MAYDEKLVERIRDFAFGAPGLSEWKMFDGVCFAIEGRLAIRVQDKDLVVCVGPEKYKLALSREHTRTFDCTGKPVTGYICVSEAGYERTADLENWVMDGIEYVRTLPPKRR